jgi:hypothetical protein
MCVHCELRPRIQLIAAPGNPAPLLERGYCERCRHMVDPAHLLLRHQDTGCLLDCVQSW